MICLAIGLCSVLLIDLDGICSEKNGGSHVLPGIEVNLICKVNFTSHLGYNILTWYLPLPENKTNQLSHNNSEFSSTAAYTGELVNTTLTGEITTKSSDSIYYSAVLHQNYSVLSSNATFCNESSTNATVSFTIKPENANVIRHNAKLDSQTFLSNHILYGDLSNGTLSVKSESENIKFPHSSVNLYHHESIYSSNATFNGDSACATLSFTPKQSLDGQVITCGDSLGYSETCTMLIFSEFTFTVKDIGDNINSFIHIPFID